MDLSESMGVVSGCGCKEVYKFPRITYPFCSSIPILVHLKKKKVFRSCSGTFL